MNHVQELLTTATPEGLATALNNDRTLKKKLNQGDLINE
jgi:hypothetical protein